MADSRTEIIFDQLIQPHGTIGVITLNRPEALNAMSRRMFAAIKQQLNTWQQDDSIQAIIIEGAGERAFCAGGDIRSLYQAWQRGTLSKETFFKDEYSINRLIYHYHKPYIALLNGLTMGGGAGLSIPGRWRIATEHFVFAMPETAIGLFPDVGMGYFLSRLPCYIGYYLALTGEKIGPEDALALGLIDAVISRQDLPKLRQALINAHYIGNGDETIAHLVSEYQTHLNTTSYRVLPKAKLIEKYFAAPTVELIITGLKASVDTWCHQTAALLETRSPTSLKVTFQHLQRCAALSFSQVIAENTHLAQQFLKTHDLFEGIRAALIDKDKAPHWQPATLTEVSTEMLNTFFADRSIQVAD